MDVCVRTRNDVVCSCVCTMLRLAVQRCRLSQKPLLRRRASTTKLSAPKNWKLPVAGGVFIGLASLYFFLPDPSRSAPTSSNKPLSANHFTPATVISNEISGPNSKILKLRVPPHLVIRNENEPIGFGPIWSVFIKDDDIQVERPYTPLESIDENGNMLFWIKRYPKGEVGRWLHSKQVGDAVELRGPLKTWPWDEGEWNEVVLVRLLTRFNNHPLKPARSREAQGSHLSTNSFVK